MARDPRAALLDVFTIRLRESVDGWCNKDGFVAGVSNRSGFYGFSPDECERYECPQHAEVKRRRHLTRVLESVAGRGVLVATVECATKTERSRVRTLVARKKGPKRGEYRIDATIQFKGGSTAWIISHANGAPALGGRLPLPQRSIVEGAEWVAVAKLLWNADVSRVDHRRTQALSSDHRLSGEPDGTLGIRFDARTPEEVDQVRETITTAHPEWFDAEGRPTSRVDRWTLQEACDKALSEVRRRVSRVGNNP